MTTWPYCVNLLLLMFMPLLGMRLFAKILGKISLVGRSDMCDSLDVMLILFRQKWITLELCVFFRKKSTADCT